jgi:hypothetical protein
VRDEVFEDFINRRYGNPASRGRRQRPTIEAEITYRGGGGPPGRQRAEDRGRIIQELQTALATKNTKRHKKPNLFLPVILSRAKDPRKTFGAPIF